MRITTRWAHSPAGFGASGSRAGLRAQRTSTAPPTIPPTARGTNVGHTSGVAIKASAAMTPATMHKHPAASRMATHSADGGELDPAVIATP
jgi:hypothetical protein